MNTKRKERLKFFKKASLFMDAIDYWADLEETPYIGGTLNNLRESLVILLVEKIIEKMGYNIRSFTSIMISEFVANISPSDLKRLIQNPDCNFISEELYKSFVKTVWRHMIVNHLASDLDEFFFVKLGIDRESRTGKVIGFAIKTKVFLLLDRSLLKVIADILYFQVVTDTICEFVKDFSNTVKSYFPESEIDYDENKEYDLDFLGDRPNTEEFPIETEETFPLSRRELRRERRQDRREERRDRRQRRRLRRFQ